MQWSRAFLTKEMAESKVMEFTPQKIDLGTPEKALEYIANAGGSAFTMNDSVKVHTGVDILEAATTTEKVEERALQMLQEVQQNAYNEAYQLGLDEGRKKAFEEASAQIAADLTSFEDLLKIMQAMKTEIVSQNEAHFMKLLYHMASRIAGAELNQNNDAVLDILRKAASMAQDDEEIHVELNPAQVTFIEELKKQHTREFDFLKTLQIDPNEDVRVGGCIIQTNHGEIDAQIETRLGQLWQSLEEVIPKVKDRIAG